MKNLVLLAAFSLSAAFASAQMPKIQRAEIKTPGARCEACKVAIEAKAPKYVDGLMKINVIWKRGVTLVQWYPDRTNIEELKAAIANVGFDADDVKAVTENQKRLPPCCQVQPAKTD